MAQFELRIYHLPCSLIEEIEADHERYMSDNEFIKFAELKGNVRTLSSLFTTGGLIETRVNVYRAYLIDVDNPIADPVRVDLYKTCITSNKVIAHRTDYEDGCKDKPYTVYEE